MKILDEVQRVLYGLNQGQLVQTLDLPADISEAAQAADYDIQAYSFRAAPEQMRKPRVVRVGLIQNSIKEPTTAPFDIQRQVLCNPS